MKSIFSRALCIILPLFIFSLFLAGVIISVANDMYAFFKDNNEVTVIVEEGSTINDISRQFSVNGIIKNPDVFVAYVKSKNKVENVEKFFGELTLNSSMSYREILLSMI